MDNFIYKERRLSRTEEMFHAVFSSKAVLTAVILSCIVCLADIVFAVCCGFMIREFTPENWDEYIFFIPDMQIDPYEILQNMGVAFTGMAYFFAALAGAYVWIAIGTLLVYIRTKSPDPQKSVRTGFTLLQALGIFKLVTGGMWILLLVFTGFVMLQDMETFIAGIILLAVIAVNLIYTISMIVFCASVKRTADGIMPSSAGAGTLQFGAFITGLVQGIIAVLLLISMFAPIEQGLPPENVKLLEKIQLDFIVITAVWLTAAVIHFLVFAVVRNYAKKLPLAVNADMVYQNNMANLYPDTYSPHQNYQPYSPNRSYQSPQAYRRYDPNQSYQSPQPNQNYAAFQPPESNNIRVPYDATNDADDHGLMDNTQYPPYDPEKNIEGDVK